MGVVTATVTVAFTNPEGDGELTAEVDNREDGPNEGKTSFAPGDDVYLLIRKSKNLTVEGYSTLGSVQLVGPVEGMEERETVVFARTRTAELSKTPSGGVDFKWLGTPPGTPVVKGKTVNLTGAYDKKNPPIGIAIATYQSAGESWRLTGIPSTINGETSFEVLVVMVGTTD